MDGLIRLRSAQTFPVSPNPPVGRYYIGIDATDGRLKKQNSSGVVTDYDSGASFSAEDAQDAVGGILQNSSTLSLTYNDAGGTITGAVIPGGVNHNALLNYVADEHVPHSAVEMQTAASSGLSGGGSIAATRALRVDMSGVADKARPESGDFMLVQNGSTLRRVKYERVNFTSPDRYRFLQNDFITETLGGLVSTVSGTGASAQAGTFGVDLTEQAQGVVQIDTGTTATGRSFLGSANVNALWVAAGQIIRWGSRVVPELLSSGVDTFIMHVGLLDNSGGGEPTDGAYFRYTDAVNGGRWEAIVAAGGTRQAFDTGVLAQQQYQVLEVEIDFTGPSPVARFFIDGVLTNTVTAPSPVPQGPTQAFGMGVSIAKTVGTSQRNLSMDWYYFELDRSTAR